MARTGHAVRRVPLIGLAALWWWAVLRLLFAPGAGTLEGTVAAGGWGLSLLPVHCVAKSRAAGALETGRWRRALAGKGPAVTTGAVAAAGAGAEGEDMAGAEDAVVDWPPGELRPPPEEWDEPRGV
ncbi:hypothetical protein [Streptomyces sp. NPDC008150]|uniref:hypothetical protein n=1 Tax=Streptomyces sp. NPDC008150 TaxID=3364816 RepID=UPI0036EDF545